jgi:predicted metal-dependent hydrolase
MPASLKTIFSGPEPAFAGRPVKVVRHARARVMRLRVDPRDGAVRLTLPRRASLRRAYAWVESQRPWVEAQLSAIAPRTTIEPDMILEVAGTAVAVVHDPSTRTVRRDGDRLRVGGGAEMFEARVIRWIKAEARRLLEAETRAMAAHAGLRVGRVSVADTRSRWGSCSAAGDIRYNWRLILAPDFVRRSTVAHEVAHRVHMNHGPDFKRLETELLGESPDAARAWLRAHGQQLYRFGRS